MPVGTLLARQRVISLTAYCLACHFSVPVHSPFYPKSRGGSHLIIRHCPKREGQVGAGQVLASIRQGFWMLRGNTAVQQGVGKCLKCRQWNTTPCQQIMTPLPSTRVTPCCPLFSSVGVDYFGPILIMLRCSQVKRYGCVFKCLAIHTVHI